MRTRSVRYGAGAVLAALAVGLLVSSGVAHAAPHGAATVRHGGVTGCVFPASVRARGEMINAGECVGTPEGQGRPAETYPAGRAGHAVLGSNARACVVTHPERRELARSCPVAGVIIFP